MLELGTIPLLITGGVILLIGLGAYRWGRRHGRRQQALAELYEKSPLPLLRLDLEGYVTTCNRAASEMLHVPRKQLVGSSLQSFVDFNSSELEQLRSEGALSIGMWDGSIEMEDEKTEIRFFVSYIEQPEEAPYLIAVLLDDTETFKEYRTFKDFHRTTLDGLPIELAILTPSGEYLYVNPEMMAKTKAREWLIGKTDFEFLDRLGVHPEAALRRRAYRNRAFEEEEPVRFEEQLMMPDGEVYYDRYYTPVFDSDGDPYAAVFYGIETTEHKQQEKEVEVARERTKRFERMKGTFLENVGHEFRTPLASILGASQVLEEEVGEQQQEFVEIIRRNGERLMETLNAMLDISRLEGEGISLRPRLLDVVSEMRDVVESLQPRAEEKSLFLRMKAAQPEIYAQLDQEGLQRVLKSLIGNALKFTEEGGVLTEIAIEEGHVQVQVMDTGVGIDDSFRSSLFGEFEQESQGLMREYEGTGLGLALAKRLTDAMNGSITVESKKGEGSTFRLSFPLAFRKDEGSDGKPRVLLQGTQDEERKVVQRMLEPYLHVETAASGGYGIHGSPDHYAAVYVEADMCRQMTIEMGAGEQSEQSIPVIAIGIPSGMDESEQEFAPDAVVPKPFERIDLLQAFDRVHSKNHSNKLASA